MHRFKTFMQRKQVFKLPFAALSSFMLFSLSVMQLFGFACFIHAHITENIGQPGLHNVKKLDGNTESVARLPGAASNFPVPSAGEPCK